MVKILDADLIKGHFIINDDDKRILVDSGGPKTPHLFYSLISLTENILDVTR